MKILFQECYCKTTALIIALSTVIIINSNNAAHALNVLVVGGSGRVGGSTVRWIKTLSDRQQEQHHHQQQQQQQQSQIELDTLGPAIITVGGRRRESYEAALRNNVIPPEVEFLSLDVDGDEILLKKTLQQWQSSCNGYDDENRQSQQQQRQQQCCSINTHTIDEKILLSNYIIRCHQIINDNNKNCDGSSTGNKTRLCLHPRPTGPTGRSSFPHNIPTQNGLPPRKR
mmetsp:Transcript_5934/g.10804  ORF Transcript_5934/g.10804 Transcript_5934/m.10804 type:complete len:228 (-) Transcript_5934:679-1362(-)